MLCRTSSRPKLQQTQMRKNFIKIRPAKPWKRLSKKAVETQLEMFRDRSTSLYEDSRSPQRPPGAYSALVQQFPMAKLPWVCADEAECGDESYLRTEVSSRQNCDILTLLLFHLTQGTRNSSYTPHDQPPDNLLSPKYLLLPIPASPDQVLSIHTLPRHTSLCL